MATEADRVVQALHSGHDELAAVVSGLTDAQLTGPSAAAEWTVAQVLSHLGSGAQITLAGLEAALAGAANPGNEANQQIWACWNAMSPQEQAAGFLEADTALLARYDSLDAATRASLLIDLGFLPAPVDLASAARFRLNEFALHSWDVRVALDPAAVVHPDAPPLLLDLVGFMLGWLAKPAPLDGRTVTLRVDLTAPESSFGLVLGEPCSIGEVPTAPDAVLTAGSEAWLRLVGGRLAPQYTPASVSLTGDLSLDTLRRVFPGF